MKPLEIKGARARLGYKQQYMADNLGISVATYRKKESGVIRFTDQGESQGHKAAGAYAGADE